VAAVTAVLALSVTAGAVGTPAFAGDDRQARKASIATGYGGAVSTVDLDASAAAIEVLRHGGNAADAAVAAAATLGVTEPYSAGIGGGGYFVFYDAQSGEVQTIDGRETAPETMPADAFINSATQKPYPFAELVSSGVSVGVPGSLATWERALKRWGTLKLGDALQPAIDVAQDGFVVDDTFRQQTLDNKVRFSAFTPTSSLFLPGGDAPAVGSIFRNPDLADTYRLIAKKGTDAFYAGPLAEEIAAAVQAPPKDPAWVPPAAVPAASIPAFPGYLTTADLAAYTTLDQDPTHVEYRGYDVYGMAPSSSGGTTVGEALNILEPFNLGEMSTASALHHYLEASALAFADRGKYVGDPAFVDVPADALTDPLFGKERSCNINPATAATKPVAAGDVSTYDGACPVTPAAAAHETDTENVSTTNMTVADKWGNVVEYTLTIEQTGGSGIVVPGRGFLLNNELTDFSYDSTNPEDPNRVEPGKRPRSSMSPTIILKDEKPFLALGSPGGSTIITTVLQTILNRVDLGMTVGEAIAAPRAAQRNTVNVTAEPGFISAYGSDLRPYGHKLVPAGDAFTSAAEIGAATAIEFGRHGRMEAAAEPARRGGGSAMVVRPER
jgi:gamma-glutamyltranspeptidase/glutathione hydrolase